MAESWSLVLFTILGQSAAGLMLLLSISRRERRADVRRTWVAILLLLLAALASLGHLSDPSVSYFTITNLKSSWLSREILAAGLFGAGMLAWAVLRVTWVRWLASALGVAFVYVMSRVYQIPTEPFWNSPLTFWSFLCTSVLLGATLLLLLDEIAARCRPAPMRRILLGWLPLLILLVTGLRIAFALLRPTVPRTAIYMGILEIALLVVGALGLFVLARAAARLPKTETDAAADAEPRACRLFFGSLGVVALLWASAVCGRIFFYANYIWFGM